MSTISSSAVEGALLVRMRRTERELREIEGEAQRWKDTLARGTRNEQSSTLSAHEREQNLLDELPALCSEALQVAMTLRRRAETVRRSMSHIRNAAAEQSAARQGVSLTGLPMGGATAATAAASAVSGVASSPGVGLNDSAVVAGTSSIGRAFGGGRTASAASQNSNNGGGGSVPRGTAGGGATTFHSGGGSALAYFVEDFVNSEFSMQEQAWWDVMTDIERVEALAVQLLSVPSSEMSSARVRNAASMHQTKPADWMLENWDASVTTSTGSLLGPELMGSGLGRTGTTLHGVTPVMARVSPLAPSSLFSSFTSTPIPDLLLRRLQEQNRAKGLYGAASSGDHHYGSGGAGGGSGHYHHPDENSSTHIGPIFASLAANPDVMSAADFDRLPKSDPLALFMSQMASQLEEERRNRGTQPDSRFHGQEMPGDRNNSLYGTNTVINSNNNNNIIAGAGSPSLSGALAFDQPAPEPEYNVVRPEQITPERSYEELQRLKREQDEAEAEKQRKIEEAERQRKEAAEAEERRKREEREAVERQRRAEEEAEAERERRKRQQHEEELARLREEEEQRQREQEREEREAAEKERRAQQQEQQQQEQQQEQQQDDEQKKIEEAAVKIQAAERGRTARKEAAKLKEERSSSQQQRDEEAEQQQQQQSQAESPNDKQQEQQENAGNNNQQLDEPETDEEKKRLQEAAVKIQAAERGRNARKEAQRRRAESVVANQDADEEISPRAQQNAAAADSEAAGDNNNNGDENDPVAKALASGEWKEVKDPKGRTYYYHPATKKTTWDLAKELKKSGAAGCKHKKSEE